MVTTLRVPRERGNLNSSILRAEHSPCPANWLCALPPTNGTVKWLINPPLKPLLLETLLLELLIWADAQNDASIAIEVAIEKARASNTEFHYIHTLSFANTACWSHERNKWG
eukprot:Gb_40310 [translate_table: standard]